jgi:hypothetical protein
MVDVLGHNTDLIAAAAKMLSDLPKQTLSLTPVAAAPLQQFAVDCTNIDRLDLFANGRPVVSQNVTADSFPIALPVPETAGTILSAKGYRRGELVVSTRLRVSPAKQAPPIDKGGTHRTNLRKK